MDIIIGMEYKTLEVVIIQMATQVHHVNIIMEQMHHGDNQIVIVLMVDKNVLDLQENYFMIIMEYMQQAIWHHGMLEQQI